MWLIVVLSQRYGCVGVLLDEFAIGEPSDLVIIFNEVNPSVTVSNFGTYLPPT